MHGVLLTNDANNVRWYPNCRPMRTYVCPFSEELVLVSIASLSLSEFQFPRNLAHRSKEPADSADVSGLVLPPLLPFVVHGDVAIGALLAVEIPPTLEADHPCLSVTT